MFTITTDYSTYCYYCRYWSPGTKLRIPCTNKFIRILHGSCLNVVRTTDATSATRELNTSSPRPLVSSVFHTLQRLLRTKDW